MKYITLSNNSMDELIKLVNAKKGYELMPGFIATGSGHNALTYSVIMVKIDD